MRKLILSMLTTMALALYAYPSLAQITEAIITFDYEMNADDPFVQQQLATLQGSSMTMSFKDHYFRTDTDMAMNKTTIIYDGKNETGLTLMNMMGVKWAIPMSKEDLELEKKASLGATDGKVKMTDEHKLIAGYNCRKVIVTKKTEQSIIYVTDEIKPANNQNDYQFKNIDGFPLMMETKLVESGVVVTITITAKTVQTKINDKEIFSTVIPGDYVEKTMADLSLIE